MLARRQGKVLGVSLGRWLILVALATACTSPTDAELLDGKKCTSDNRCAPGYTCVKGECLSGGSASTGGAPGNGGTTSATGGTHPTTGGTGGDSETGGEAGHAPTGGSRPTGGNGGDGGAGRTSTGGSGGSTGGDPPNGGTAGAAGSGTYDGTGGILCSGSTTDCSTLATALRHRYRFNGSGTTAVDSISGANGTLRGGATLSGSGQLDLAGFGQYADLPNGILSALTDATIEGWIIWDGGSDWQRIFDFGDAMAGFQCIPNGLPAGEDQQGICGRSYLLLSPQTEQLFPTESRLAFVPQPESDTSVSASGMPTNTTVHFAAVVDVAGNRLELYLDGVLEGSEDFAGSLADINDINNWLGRSQWEEDPYFLGGYLEFRIYEAALTASQIGTSFDEGPDPTFLE